MAQIMVYKPKATKTDLNANGVSCKFVTAAIVRERLNGEFSCDITTQDEIASEQIIKISTPAGLDYFRLAKPDRTMSKHGYLDYKATGWHISYDLAEDIILDCRIQQKSADEAVKTILAAGLAERRFTGGSNINARANLSIVRLSPISALIGNQDNSFSARWGGEIERKAWSVNMVQKRGTETGVLIEYRKNLTGLSIKEDTTRIVNRVIPTYLKGEKVETLLPEKLIDSNRILDTAVPHSMHIHYGDIEVGKAVDGTVIYKTDAEAMAEVRRRVESLFLDGGVDRPKIQAVVSFADLAETEQFENILPKMEALKIGDTVKIKYDNWVFYQRVIAYEWDAINERYLSIELGEIEPDLENIKANLIEEARAAAAKDVSSSIGTIVSPVIEAQAQMNRLVAQSNGYKIESRESSDGRKFTYLFDGNTLETSRYIGLISDAGQYVWTNKGWNSGAPQWTYGYTKDGNAVFNTLSVHGLNADWINAGKISSTVKKPNGSPLSWWDLTTGYLSVGAGEFFGDIKTTVNGRTAIEMIENRISLRDVYSSTNQVRGMFFVGRWGSGGLAGKANIGISHDAESSFGIFKTSGGSNIAYVTYDDSGGLSSGFPIVHYRHTQFTGNVSIMGKLSLGSTPDVATAISNASSTASTALGNINNLSSTMSGLTARITNIENTLARNGIR